MKNLTLEKFNPKKADVGMFSKKKSEIIKIVKVAKDLKIKGVDDKNGYKILHESRVRLKKIKSVIKDEGLGMRRYFIDMQKDLKKLEHDMVELIEPTEKILKERQDAIDVENDIISRKKFLPERREKLISIEVDVDDDFILSMNPTKFNEYFNLINSEFLEKKARKLQEDQDKIYVENKKIEDQKKLDDAAKQAKKDAEAKAKNDMKLAKIKAENDKKKAIDDERKRVADEKQKEIDEEERKKMTVKVEEERAKRNQKYLDFLTKNNVPNDYLENDTHEVRRVGKTFKLYKLIDQIEIQ